MEPLIIVINLLKILIIALSIFSFKPQLQSLQDRGDTVGISLVYILLILIVATEQFTLGVLIVPNKLDHDDSPLAFGDWLNLAQFGAVLLCHLVLFLYCLYLAPFKPREKAAVAVAYLIFFFLSVGFAIFVVWSLWQAKDRLAWGLLTELHLDIISPISIIPGLIAVFVQLSHMRLHLVEAESALSIPGLQIQAIIFGIVATSWIFRSDIPIGWPIPTQTGWNAMIVLITADNVIFAIGQAVLFYAARRSVNRAEVDETTGLLPQSDGVPASSSAEGSNNYQT